jgi:uncharacterized membrane protein YgcG
LIVKSLGKGKIKKSRLVIKLRRARKWTKIVQNRVEWEGGGAFGIKRFWTLGSAISVLVRSVTKHNHECRKFSITRNLKWTNTKQDLRRGGGGTTLFGHSHKYKHGSGGGGSSGVFISNWWRKRLMKAEGDKQEQSICVWVRSVKADELRR